MKLVVPPPVLAAAAAVAQRSLAGTPPARRRWRTAATGILSAASVTLAGVASVTFFKSGTTVQPFHPEDASVLITTGANVVTRNPMYVGMTGLLVAHAVWRGSWAALVPAAAFVAILDRLQIEAEESALHSKFGAEYDAYRATTPRWFGRGALSMAGRGPDGGGDALVRHW